MESQPQNPEFRNNPESFHPCSRWKVFFLLQHIQVLLSIFLNPNEVMDEWGSGILESLKI